MLRTLYDPDTEELSANERKSTQMDQEPSMMASRLRPVCVTNRIETKAIGSPPQPLSRRERGFCDTLPRERGSRRGITFDFLSNSHPLAVKSEVAGILIEYGKIIHPLHLSPNDADSRRLKENNHRGHRGHREKRIAENEMSQRQDAKTQRKNLCVLAPLRSLLFSVFSVPSVVQKRNHDKAFDCGKRFRIST
ncbi:hypothetical protein [Candidatus Thiosymbion oneisti]|uniref:hypothetical protein n=1 Tax=Candidatus Thiosymbion oneisti TaxID=589554 RepID=UPI00105EDE17|nr:hypothetical protein [Candidatus Thiosymbion oneisti]